MARLEFDKNRLTAILQRSIDKTLEEIDSRNVFARTLTHKKITGIAGDVVEQSLLGSPANSSRKPDLIVDGVDVELKTTGIRKPKRSKLVMYEAKEPLTITAVSPDALIHEEFFTSHFWKKVNNLLMVYYEYLSDVTVPAAEYRSFPIKGYDFHRFSMEEIETLKNDWEIIRDYVRDLHQKYDNPKEHYHTLSSALRNRLMFLDTSPKYPNPPRFRIKRAVVSNMVNKRLGKEYDSIEKKVTAIDQFKEELQRLSNLYAGMKVNDLMTTFGINSSPGVQGTLSKSMTEKIIIHMFEADSSRLNDIDLFSKLNITAKSVTLTESRLNTEDTKLFPVDLQQIVTEERFEESDFFSRLNEIQFLFAIFKIPARGSNRLDSTFVGFKLQSLSSSVFDSELQRTWMDVRSLMIENRLEVKEMYKKDGQLKLSPKTRVPQTETNLPKSKDYLFFLRGTGSDATKKTLSINGLELYRQDLWIRGKDLSRLLNNDKAL
ncbi:MULTISPECIES: MutH/Sau3AI family endonuclease [unclassified Exiguobacterium]|uniref:MutH/Sau3AI family endonuclease n=1 Tax=unclassified Exiguobacterium TaxID=2644629 RepID=UPI0013763433|nr:MULTISPECIES: MutH/Sau3AI family endonuclease [unclassified Exiguobacterium]